MDLDSRYQLLETLGSGSFATVFRARDLELGREVAIRQIHDEFLAHPERLERYWQEAQLLASLQHPNIVTIFDIHREKGWVILELMQASLKDRTGGRQLELKSLRTTLAHALRALKYLHAQGIVHGDIKPGNLMLDARRRIKLGDFGLARRASDADGELIKGTTKYMAPETVSDDFGEIGPASDLYSLGFSAYELLCGENFDSLFPGLSAFGGNSQIAWMMWHAAPDRRLPEIPRVLEGVPDDLVRVIHKLCEKDQSKRYRSAEQALADLDIEASLTGSRSMVMTPGGPSADGSEPEETTPPKDTKRLVLLSVAVGASLLMSLVMLFSGGGGTTEDNRPTQQIGIVREALADQNALILLDAETGAAREISLGEGPLIYFRNEDKNILLREIAPGDRVAMETKESSGRKYLSLIVDRAETTRGTLVSRDPRASRITIALQTGSDRGELTLRVPERARIRINSGDKTLVDLEDGDEVEVSHFPELGDKVGRVLDRLTALRPQELIGYITQIKRESPPRISVSFGRGASTGPPLELPVRDDCKFFEQSSTGPRTEITFNALQENDRVKLRYDVNIREVVRSPEQTQASGAIREIAGSRMTISLDNNEQLLLTLADDCDVTVNLAAAAAGDLRVFDQVKVSYDGSASPAVATVVDAKRPVHYDRSAILIACESFDDRSLTPARNAARDARSIRAALIDRYAFDDARILLLVDPTRQSLLDQVTRFLKDMRQQTQLVVYVTGNVRRTADGQDLLPVKDTHTDRLAETSLSLRELLQAVEGSGSGDKLLLLDVCQEGTERDLANQPSSGEVLDALKVSSKTTTLIASCSPGEKSLEMRDGRLGIFAHCIGQGYKGRADADRNLLITPAELYDFLKDCVPAEAPEGKTQTPVLFAPQ